MTILKYSASFLRSLRQAQGKLFVAKNAPQDDPLGDRPFAKYSLTRHPERSEGSRVPLSVILSAAKDLSHRWQRSLRQAQGKLFVAKSAPQDDK